MDVQSPKPPRLIGLRLQVHLPPQVLQTNGRLYHLTLASRVVGRSLAIGFLRSPVITRFIATTNPSATLSPSIDFPVEPVIRSTFSGDFPPGRGGLLQLLGLSLPPCCRFHPAEVKEPHRSDFGSPCCLRPTVVGSALGATHFRGHFYVHCRYGPVTRRLPEGDVVDRLQSLGFPPPCYPNYGAPDFCPDRFVSC